MLNFNSTVQAERSEVVEKHLINASQRDATFIYRTNADNHIL